ncbi:MAG: hypothetical protein ACK56I_13110, partial [bacterium]
PAACDFGGGNQAHASDLRPGAPGRISSGGRRGQPDLVQPGERAEEASRKIGDQARRARCHPQAKAQERCGAITQQRQANFREGDAQFPDAMGRGRDR